MRVKLTAFLFGLGLVAAAATPSFACAYLDQQASSNSNQQTAQAQPPQSSQTSTQ